MRTQWVLFSVLITIRWPSFQFVRFIVIQARRWWG